MNQRLNSMRADWNDLQIFLAIERGRTAREAADRLKCSHSTVLRRLEAFEQRIGSRLFDRTPDGFQITDAGGAILGRAQQIEAEMLELERVVGGNDTQLEGKIRLTVPPPVAQYLLLPVLIDFKNTYPRIEIELVSTFGYTDLSRREADIAIRFTHTPDEHMIGRRLPEFMDAIYASPAYIRKHWTNNQPKDPQWIGWSDTAMFKTRINKTQFAKSKIAWNVPSMSLQVEATKQGMGMSFLPTLVGEKATGLKRVPNSEILKGRPAWIMRHPDLRRLERARVFTDFVADAIFKHEKLLAGVV